MQAPQESGVEEASTIRETMVWKSEGAFEEYEDAGEQGNSRSRQRSENSDILILIGACCGLSVLWSLAMAYALFGRAF